MRFRRPKRCSILGTERREHDDEGEVGSGWQDVVGGVPKAMLKQGMDEVKGCCRDVDRTKVVDDWLEGGPYMISRRGIEPLVTSFLKAKKKKKRKTLSSLRSSRQKNKFKTLSSLVPRSSRQLVHVTAGRGVGV